MRSDVPALITGIRRWHPDIAVGGGSCYLREAYDASVCLDDETRKDVFVGAFKCADELVGMWSWERLPDTLAMYGRLIVIAPEHRSAKLASAVMPLAERAGRVMGAEFLFGLATLKIPHMQRALENAGFQLIGSPSATTARRSHRATCGACSRGLLQGAGAGERTGAARPGEPHAARTGAAAPYSRSSARSAPTPPR